MWLILTIIASAVVATATVLGIYYSHKHNVERRISDLENKTDHHDKFVKILENRALQVIEEEFEGKVPKHKKKDK